MLTPVPVREIGGEFETVSAELLADESVEPPWEIRRGTAVTYLETGRQALAAVEEVLRRQGRHRLVVPSFFCDSMVLPFVRRGWEVVPTAIGDDLFPVPSSVSAALSEPRAAVVLHAPYFGQDTPPRLAEELAAVRAAGARIVVDETHRLFAAAPDAADFAVASLRKTLPLTDGAYATGLGALQVAPPGDVSRIRAQAMAAKRRQLDGAPGSGSHRPLFRRADELVAAQLGARAMSGAAAALVRRLDHAEIARRRRSNARALAAALAERDVRLLADPRGSADIPSHLVVVVPQPRALQAALAERGVYCPLHWPRPTLVHVPTWPDRLLSIPVDQRYGEADMTRIAETFDDLSRALYTMPNTKTV